MLRLSYVYLGEVTCPTNGSPTSYCIRQAAMGHVKLRPHRNYSRPVARPSRRSIWPVTYSPSLPGKTLRYHSSTMLSVAVYSIAVNSAAMRIPNTTRYMEDRSMI